MIASTLLLLFLSLVVGTLFVGPLFGFFLVLIVCPLHLALCSWIRGSNRKARASENKRMFWGSSVVFVFLVLIVSVALMGTMYYDEELCTEYDWLDNVIDGKCSSYLQAMLRGDDFVLPFFYYKH